MADEHTMGLSTRADLRRKGGTCMALVINGQAVLAGRRMVAAGLVQASRLEGTRPIGRMNSLVYSGDGDFIGAEADVRRRSDASISEIGDRVAVGGIGSSVETIRRDSGTRWSLRP